MKTLTAVYMAAGASSRFKFKIKALTKVGKNNESMMGISMKQAKEAGFTNFVIIVSKATIEPIKEVFKDEFEGIPIKYAIQETPDYREKPFGTSHALLSAKEFIEGPFIVANSDDIYGANTLKLMADYLTTNEDCYCLPAYRLRNVIPKEGGVNRGIIKEKDEYLEAIEETFDIAMKDIPLKYSGDELISMNLFGLQKEFLDFLEAEFKIFLEKYPNDPREEWLLPDTISNFKNEKEIALAVIPTEDTTLSITHPGDEVIVQEKLKEI